MRTIPTSPLSQKHIVLAIADEQQFRPLLRLGYALAKADAGKLTLLFIDALPEIPAWLEIPEQFEDIEISIEVVQGESIWKEVVGYARKTMPNLLLVGWRKTGGREVYRVRGTLDTILRQAPCDAAVVRCADESAFATDAPSVCVPVGGGPNAPLAMELALKLSPDTTVTALHIVTEGADNADFLSHQKQLSIQTAKWQDNPRLATKTIRAENILKGITQEAEKHTLTMIGASNESIFDQIIFGALPSQVALKNSHNTIIVKRFDGSVSGDLNRLWWKITHPIPILNTEERVDVYKEIRRGARPNVDFFVMIALASAIASLGLLLNSPAVIIGAMLVAPLMSAIMGMGLGTIQADSKLLRLAGSATARGTLLAIGVGLIAKLIVPTVDAPTTEILARTVPSLLDLGVALFSGLAGAYALSRKDMSSSLPGVAIAAALVPPLSTVGIGIAWLRWDIAGGALLLFLTNLVTIIAASALIFFLLGFRPKLKRDGRSKIFRRAVVSSTILLGLMIWVLSILSIQSYQNTAKVRKIDQVLHDKVSAMNGNIKLESWEMLSDANADTLNLEVRVRAPIIPVHSAVIELQNEVATALEYPTALTLISVRTTELDPLIPPTPTRTPLPNITPTVTPSPTKLSTATASPPPSPTPTTSPTSTENPPSPAPTATASATATPTITNSPTPPPTPTATPATGVIAYTDGRGVVLRWTPGGLRAGAIPENSVVRVFHGQQLANEIVWLKIEDNLGRIGWIAADYVEILP